MITEQRRNSVCHGISDHTSHGLGRGGGFRSSGCYLSSCRAITTRWIWLVPS